MTWEYLVMGGVLATAGAVGLARAAKAVYVLRVKPSNKVARRALLDALVSQGQAPQLVGVERFEARAAEMAAILAELDRTGARYQWTIARGARCIKGRGPVHAALLNFLPA